MKTKLWATALALLVAATGFATETPKMNIVSAGKEKALVTFEMASAEKMELSVTNSDGVVLYEWKSNEPQKSYNKVFDFAELGEDTYDVCINYGGKSLNQAVHVTRTGIKVDPVVESFEPYFSYKNGQLKVSFLNASQKNVYLNVYCNGEYISGATLGKGLDIPKCVDLSNLKNGDYQVVLTEYFKDHSFLVHK